MIRTLLTTTGLALLLATPAFAQAAPAANPPAAMTPADPAAMLPNYLATDTDNLATRIIGQPVYASAAADADKIGDINDIVLTADGGVGAVVLGVGGFLGIGEKNVAVDFKSLQWTVAADNTERWVLPATKEQLQAAADFQWRADQPAAANTQTAATPAPAAPAANPNAQTPAANTAANAAPNGGGAQVDPNAQPATDTAAANQNSSAMNSDLQTAQDTNATNPAATPIDRNAMTPVDVGTLTADKLIGTKVVGPDNQQIAEVGDIVLTQDGKVDSLLIDFGGFLGIGEKRVAIGLDNLNFVADANGGQYVYLNVTKEQLDAAPAYDEANYNANRDQQRMVVTQ